MISNDKIKDIQKLLKSGYPEGELKNDLLKEGYTQEEIAKVFEAHKPDMRSWYLIFAILILLIGIYFAGKLISGLLLLSSAALFYQYYEANKKLGDKVN